MRLTSGQVGAQQCCAPTCFALEVFGGAEGADYGGGVVLVGVDFGVHVAHVGGGDFSGEAGEGRPERR